jgi:hypothetical protein
MVCKFLDSMHILKDFFLTYEFDSRVRLNYVFEEGEGFPQAKLSDCLMWHYMKKCFQELHRLKLNGIVVQEMHPDNIHLMIRDNVECVFFAALIYKLNLPSIFTDKFIPIQGCLEFMEPKLIQGTLQ